MPDVLVTGLPRSGLTAASALIDSLPGAVSLNSPQIQGAQARKLGQTIPFCKWLAGDFVWQRSRLSTQDPINDYRAADGSHLWDGLKDPHMLRDEEGNPKLQSFTRAGLSGDFILSMKQDTLYSCVLPSLIEMEHFRIIVVIRHPYEVIRSWESLPDEQIGQGKIAFARHYWPEAALIDPEQAINLPERMMHIYELFMQRYYECSRHIHILKYEDLIEDPSLICKALGVHGMPPAAAKINRKNPMRDAEKLAALRERFRKSTVFTRYFYPDMGQKID